MAIAVESVEMGGGGGRLNNTCIDLGPRPIMFLAWRLCACDDIESIIHVHIDRHLICDVNLLKFGN